MIVKCYGRNSVLDTLLAVSEDVGPGRVDQFGQCSSFEVVLIYFLSSAVELWSNQVQQKRLKIGDGGTQPLSF